MTKIPKLSNFQNNFYAFFLSKFLTNFVDWVFGKGQQGENVLSSRLSEEFIAVFYVRSSQIDTENDKKPSFDRSRGLKTFKGSTRKKWVVE